MYVELTNAINEKNLNKTPRGYFLKDNSFFNIYILMAGTDFLLKKFFKVDSEKLSLNFN